MTTAYEAPLVKEYLRRIGVSTEPVGVDALTQLHRAHVERIPYETFWLHLNEGWGIGQQASLNRIVLQRRGGYCFHLNGALAHVLNDLGYHASLHVAGVHDHNGPNPDTMGNHVAVVVHDLPTDTNPAGRWYVDTGLGDVLYEPLALTPTRSDQYPGTYRLERVVGGPGDWHFDAGPGSSLGGVSIDLRPVPIARFKRRHRYNTRSPQSSFTHTVTAQRRHYQGSDVLRGCVLTRTRAATRTVTTLATRAEWLQVLADLFDLHLAGASTVAPDRLDRLWARVQASHQAWLDHQLNPTTKKEAAA